MNEPVFLCPSDQLTEGRYREFRVEPNGDPVWLIATRVGGSPRAWLNVCPHQGRPLNFAPDRFLTDPEQRLVCAHHGAVFEPDAGVCVSGPCQRASLTAVPVRETQGRVSVEGEALINTPG